MLGGRNGISAGRVEHDDAAARGRLNIDIVHADTGAADHAQSRSGIQNFCGHFGFTAHNDGAEVGNEMNEFRFAQNLS